MSRNSGGDFAHVNNIMMDLEPNKVDLAHPLSPLQGILLDNDDGTLRASALLPEPVHVDRDSTLHTTMTVTMSQARATASNTHSNRNLVVPTKKNPNPFATRGIYRPNAQRLSISLQPLVAQRSLLFRVKTDMSMCTSYEDTSSPEEYRGLYTLTPTASARLISAVLSSARFSAIPSAASPASVYSQESWKSPSGIANASANLHPSIAAAFLPAVTIDARRQAIVFSPNIQWSDHSSPEDEGPSRGPGHSTSKRGSDKDSISGSSEWSSSAQGIKAPPDSPGAPVQMVQVKVQIVGPKDSLIDPDEDVFARDPPKRVNVLASANIELYLPPPAPVDVRRPPLPLPAPASVIEAADPSAAVGVVNSKKLQKKKVSFTSDLQKRASSKPSKAFGRVISHLSLQPSKKEVAAAVNTRQNRKTIASIQLSPGYKLPELKLAEPLNMSFFANTRSPPLAIMPAPIIPPIGDVGALSGPRKNGSTPNRATTQPFPTVPRPKALIEPPHASSSTSKVEPAHGDETSAQSNIAFPQGQRARPQRPTRPPHLAPFPLLPSLSIPRPQHLPVPPFQHPHPATPHRAASPPPLSTPTAERTLGPPLAAIASRKGHRRYKSSPAVPEFMLEELAKQGGHGHGKKRWDVESMPPLPPMPVLPPLANLNAGAGGNGLNGNARKGLGVTTMVGQAQRQQPQGHGPPAIPPRSTARPNSNLISEPVLPLAGAPVRARAMSATNRIAAHASPAKMVAPFPLPRPR